MGISCPLMEWHPIRISPHPIRVSPFFPSSFERVILGQPGCGGTPGYPCQGFLINPKETEAT